MMKCSDRVTSARRSLAALKQRGSLLARRMLILVSAILPLATPAHAGTWCTGKVVQVFATRDGGVVMLPQFRNDFVQVCNLTTAWKDVPSTTCGYWYATLTAGLLEAKSFTFYYDDATAVCATMPPYSGAPSPYYVMVNE